MAKKKAPSRAARRKAYAKSLNEVKKAKKNLDLKLKKHASVVSSMFFPSDPGPGSST
jgi:hypothetical protein